MGSLLDTPVGVNDYDFSETTLSDRQVLVPNAEGRTVEFAELVYLNGYFGNVVDQDGIETAKSGRIDIDSQRIIRTEQMAAADTFVVDATLWFKSGGAGAAGELLDADPGTGTRVAVGVITGFGGTGGAHTYVEFRPFVQLQAAVAAVAVLNAEPKTIVQKIIADASAGIAVAGLGEGDEIVGAHIICTTANENGTLILETGADDDITNGMICAVDKTVVVAGTIDDAHSVLPATGAQILSVGGAAANTRGIMVITYIPVAV